jgi:hypothetical protein
MYQLINWIIENLLKIENCKLKIILRLAESDCENAGDYK